MVTHYDRFHSNSYPQVIYDLLVAFTFENEEIR